MPLESRFNPLNPERILWLRKRRRRRRRRRPRKPRRSNLPARVEPRSARAPLSVQSLRRTAGAARLFLILKRSTKGKPRAEERKSTGEGVTQRVHDLRPPDHPIARRLPAGRTTKKPITAAQSSPMRIRGWASSAAMTFGRKEEDRWLRLQDIDQETLTITLRRPRSSRRPTTDGVPRSPSLRQLGQVGDLARFQRGKRQSAGVQHGRMPSEQPKAAAMPARALGQRKVSVLARRCRARRSRSARSGGTRAAWSHRYHAEARRGRSAARLPGLRCPYMPCRASKGEQQQ
jgi:hypothetical protein